MVNNVTHDELKEHIRIAYDTKTPLFVWGGVGVGKSETIKSVAQEIAEKEKLPFSDNIVQDKAFSFLDVRISQLEPSDLRGLPIQDVKSGTTKWLSPSWLPQDKDSKGILFFDELNLSPPSIQAVAYQLILDRRVGEYILPQGWLIVSAGNREQDRCNVFDMSKALCNRFIHAELMIPTTEKWTSWAIKNNIDSRIISFLNFKPNSLYQDDDKYKDKAFATPRSWVYCSRLIKGRPSNALTEHLIASCVGEGTSKELTAFLRLQTKIDLNDLIKNPKQIKEIKEIDLKYVLLGTIAERYRTDKKDLEKYLAFCDYLEAEYGILLLRFLRAVEPQTFVKKIASSKKGDELITRYKDYLID